MEDFMTFFRVFIFCFGRFVDVRVVECREATELLGLKADFVDNIPLLPCDNCVT